MVSSKGMNSGAKECLQNLDADGNPTHVWARRPNEAYACYRNNDLIIPTQNDLRMGAVDAFACKRKGGYFIEQDDGVWHCATNSSA